MHVYIYVYIHIQLNHTQHTHIHIHCILPMCQILWSVLVVWHYTGGQYSVPRELHPQRAPSMCPKDAEIISQIKLKEWFFKNPMFISKSFTRNKKIKLRQPIICHTASSQTYTEIPWAGANKDRSQRNSLPWLRKTKRERRFPSGFKSGNDSLKRKS